MIAQKLYTLVQEVVRELNGSALLIPARLDDLVNGVETKAKLSIRSASHI